MEGPERAQPVHFCLNRIVYQYCRVLWTWKGLSEPSVCVQSWCVWKGLNIVIVYRIVYKSCRVLWTWKGLSEPSLTFLAGFH